MGLPVEIKRIRKPKNVVLTGVQGDTFYREFTAQKKVNGVWTAMDISDVEEITFTIATERNPDEGELIVEGTGGFTDDGTDGGYYIQADKDTLAEQSTDPDDDYVIGYHRVRMIAANDDDSTEEEVRTVMNGQFRLEPDLDTESD